MQGGTMTRGLVLGLVGPMMGLAGCWAAYSPGDDEVGVECEVLSPVECVNRPGCVPGFDDRLYPSCAGTGPAIPEEWREAQDWVVDRCVPYEMVCTPGPGRLCWRLAEGTCEGGPGPRCERATPTGSSGCNVPGCIVVEQPRPGGPGVSARRCAPLEGLQCEASCSAPRPDCGEEMMPEVRDGCFTGGCVHTSWCASPPVLEP